MSLYSHCVRYGKEYLLREWDAEKNAPVTPADIAVTSTTRVWWRCERDHSWQTQLSSRARANTGCPLCLREKIDARVVRRRAAEAEKKRHKKSNIGSKEE